MKFITQMSLLQKRIIFSVGLAGIAAFVFTFNNPLAGDQASMLVSETGETTVITLGIVENVNLDRTAEGVGVKVGQAAPNFALEDESGSLVQLSQFLGEKAVVVNFWASWCPFCLEEMPDLQRVFKEFEDDLVIIGINNMETPAQGDSYAVERGVTYPTLYFPKDPDVVSAYEVLAMPTTYYLTKDGVIAVRKIGFDTFEGIREKVLIAIGG